MEKLAPKKGVIVQSVKEVLQALVDDSLVHQDKIGISNFFWSFPSEAAVKVLRTLTSYPCCIMSLCVLAGHCRTRVLAVLCPTHFLRGALSHSLSLRAAPAAPQ